MTPNSLSSRMKEYYEQRYKIALPMRMPVIIRLDGRAFHTFTKYMEKPYDKDFVYTMNAVALSLVRDIDGVELAYIQSDEISLLLHNYKRLNSEAWFSNEIQKMTSVAAGMASAFMSLFYARVAVFDARVFVLPEAEVNNYFIWRQQDATRNSILMVAQAHFTHRELHGKSCKTMMDMLHEKGINWNDLPTDQKRGRCVTKANGYWHVDNDIPIFTENRAYVEDCLSVIQE